MKNKLYFSILSLLVFLFSANFAFAADIFFSSDKVNVTEGKTFTVTINTNTSGVYINNIESIISFPTKLLNVESISSAGSIFSMWVEQPKFSNIDGTVFFNGGVPTPGYIGSKGKILSIVFKAKQSGKALISFSSANIFANDGMGTDVTSGRNGISINIGETTLTPVKEAPKKVEVVVPIKKEIADTTPPRDLTVIPSVTADDLVLLKISSNDDISGVNKYKVSIDSALVSENIVDNNPMDITLPPEKSGNHEISVIAYDRVGNLSEKILDVNFPEIKAPQITKYPTTIKKGEAIEISGTSYQNTDVRIWVLNENSSPKNYIIKTSNDGKFTFSTDFIDQPGLTSFWAETLRTNDIVSPPSQKYFVVVDKTEIVKTGLLTIQVLGILILVSILFVILLSITFYAYRKLRRMRRRIFVDLEGTESEAHKIFKIINEDIKQSMKIFRKKDIKDKLTQNDRETIDSLEKDVEEAEEYFTKRIKNIEKKDL